MRSTSASTLLASLSSTWPTRTWASLEPDSSRDQQARQHDPCLVGILAGPADQVAQIGDRGAGLPGLDVELGEHQLQREGVPGALDLGGEFGPRRRVALLLAQEADQGGDRLVVVGQGGDDGAQLRLGGGEIVVPERPFRAQLPEARLLREGLDDRAEMRAQRRLVALFLDHLQLQEIERDVAGVGGDGLVRAGQRRRDARALAQIADLGQEHLGVHGRERPGLFHGGPGSRLVTVAQRDDGGERMGLGLVGGLLERSSELGPGLVDVVGEHVEACELEPCGGMARVEFGDAPIAREGRLEVAAPLEDAGGREERGHVIAVERERVRELENRLVRRAFGEQFLAALVVLGDPFLDAVAGGEDECQRKRREKCRAPEKRANPAPGEINPPDHREHSVEAACAFKVSAEQVYANPVRITNATTEKGERYPLSRSVFLLRTARPGGHQAVAALLQRPTSARPPRPLSRSARPAGRGTADTV